MSPERIKQICNQAVVDATPYGKILYLDTKYWVEIREATDTKSDPGAYREVHELLRRLTGTRKISIAASLPVLEEVRKQNEPTVSQTLALMYDLCRCYMVNPLDLDTLEFNSYPINKYPRAWTLPANMLAEVVVSCAPKLPKDEDDAEKVQKYIDDFRKRITLKDFVETSLCHPPVKTEEQRVFIEGQNTQIEQNRENYPFPKLFAEVGRAKAEQIVRRWKNGGRLSEDTELHYPRDFWWPGCIIPAWLLAYVACDVSGEKMKKGDDVDFLHARLALPYCDYFFTDGRMKHLLSIKPPAPLLLSKT